MLPISDENVRRRFPLITVALIATNVALFFLWQAHVGMRQSVALAGLTPTELTPISLPGVEHVFTSMFMHSGIFHLAGNMWFLWIFGDNVEDEIGRMRFVFFYLLCGIAAAATHVAFTSQPKIPMVGASGAISGVLGGYLTLHPNARVKMLFHIFFVRMPAWVYLFIWIAIQVAAQANSAAQSRVAYLAHIGGFAAGILLAIFVLPRRNPVDF